jgi:cytochrome oxidase Cu insertion factor (SCO1/SenC/PrrC family)
MEQKARLRVALIIFAVAIVVGLVGLPYLLDWRSGKAFERIARGDQETRVILYLGYPDARGGCGTQLRWDQESLGANDGRCVTEVRYKGRHGAWVVGYSADAHVVSKYFETPGQTAPEVRAAQ